MLALTSSPISCSSSSAQSSAADDAGVADVQLDGGPGVQPVDALSDTYVSAFYASQSLFYEAFDPSQGLGPLYTKTACSDCHAQSARGPGAATKMVVVDSDGATPASDQTSLLPFGNTEHPLTVATIPGVRTPILPPFSGAIDGGVMTGPVSIRVSTRLGPPLFGRGYIEAIEDSEIQSMASQQASRSDGIHGRVNSVVFASQPNPDSTFDSYKTGDTVIGRFGLKSRIATLDEFAADALQNDIGITSPMRPTEFTNPDGVTDDLKPGVDTTASEMNTRAMYARLLAIPPRSTSPQTTQGESWFVNCSCSVCHAESLHTRSDYPIPQLANIDAFIYSDLLLHDMGDGLADSVTGGNEGQAGPRDWRTLPLIGLRFSQSYLHDGRASNIQDAILAHSSSGSEANGAVACFSKLSSLFQQQLITFVESL
jgi:CxxC motif-containing protein (DUF1111 family)